MKAIILASGMGTRLGYLSMIPKALLKIKKKTLIERQLDSLLENNIKQIIITTGFQADAVTDFVGKKTKYKNLHIEFVFNAKYKMTNYIYSLWLAREKLKDADIIMLHGDVVYDYSLFTKVVKKRTSHVTVANNMSVTPKDLKAEVKNGKVIYIGTDPTGKQTYLCSSILKLTKKDMKIWMDEINNFVKRGVTDCYAEDAFNKVSHKMDLRPLYFDRELAMDVDNQDDLKVIRDRLKEK